RLAVVVRLHRQPARKIPITEDLDPVNLDGDQPGLMQQLDIARRTLLEPLEIRHVHHAEAALEIKVAEPAPGKPAEAGHLPMLMATLDILATACLGALGTATRGLTLATGATTTL